MIVNSTSSENIPKLSKFDECKNFVKKFTQLGVLITIVT